MISRIWQGFTTYTGKLKDTEGYFAVTKAQEIICDPRRPDMYLAVIESGTYLGFGEPVRFRDTGNIVERGLLNDQDRFYGRAQAVVRTLNGTTDSIRKNV